MKDTPAFFAVLLFLITGCISCNNKDSIDRLSEVKPDFKVEPVSDNRIFPDPAEIYYENGRFIFDSNTAIVIPAKKSSSDSFLAGLISGELADKYEMPVPVREFSGIDSKGKFILIGDLSNPLVRTYCRRNKLLEVVRKLGEEGYILRVTQDHIVVAASTGKGALYGLESLLQLLNMDGESLSVQEVMIKDSPKYAFRGIKLYLPGRENIPFFRRFIKDFAARYKFNTIILELNANMRLERHPELNIGTVQFERHLTNSRLDRPPGQHQEFQNSSHQDNADGEILEKEEVADLISYMRKFNIEVIPELPSLTHSYYLLFGHRELAENLNQPYPDTYCPLKPEIYNIYFDVLDEYIDVIGPRMIHVGHDEWRMEKDLCNLCRGKDYGKLYADDLNKIHDYLAGKGIRTAIWGDHLLESVTEKDHQDWKTRTGYEYKIPGALTPDQVTKLIPKDILIFNWFWDDINNDKMVSEFGFQQVYGNFLPGIEKWDERIKTENVLGGAPSSWAATTELNFGKDQIFDFLGCANLLWSGSFTPEDKLTFIVEPMVHKIYESFAGKPLPGEKHCNVIPLDISSYFNSSLSQGIDSMNHRNLLSGEIVKGNRIFMLHTDSDSEKRAISVCSGPRGMEVFSGEGIQLNRDVNSLLFLHACAGEGSNKKAYDIIHNFEETAELLGWYEVVYEDGFVETIPIRYGLNILDWNWYGRISSNSKPLVKYSQNRYAWQASAVECSRDKSDPITFFAFEWENKRLGKKVTEINLRPVNSNNDNPVVLLAVSFTEKKSE